LVAGFIQETVAFDIGAPLRISVTLPEMMPCVVCAIAGSVQNKQSHFPAARIAPNDTRIFFDGEMLQLTGRGVHVAAACLYLAVFAAQVFPQEQPVAVVLAGSGGSFLRSKAETSLNLYPGEVLFDGDSFRAQQGSVTVLHCPSGQVVDLPIGSVASVTRKQLKVSPRLASPARSVPVCRLPEMERTPRAESYHLGASLFAGESRPTAGPLVEPPRNEGEAIELLARLTRAQQEKRVVEAQAICDALLRYWADAAWLKPRLFVQGQGVAALSQPLSQGGPRTFAVVVGVSNYARLPADKQLRFAHRDALDFSEFLKSGRGGSLAPDVNLKVLVDRNATVAAVRNALNTVLKDKAGPNDTAILFVACHGASDNTGAYLMLYDTDPQNLAQTALSMEELRQLVAGQLARVKLVVAYVDACRSGRIAVIHKSLKGIERPDGILFGFTASEASESSYERADLGGGHGVFSWFLDQALNGEAKGNRGQTVTVDNVIQYVREKVREATGGRQNPDTFGTFDRQTMLADLRLPGPTPTLLASAASGPARARGLDEHERRVDLENRGQSVIVRYLDGEQNPVPRADFVDAAEAFAAARRQAPESVWLEAREDFCKGRVAVFDKQYESAIDLLERAIRLDPAGAVAYNALGIAYLERADNGRALAAFDDAISRAPQWAYAWHNRALAQTQTGDYSAAIRSYQHAIALAPTYLYLPYNLGVLYQTLNRRREAAAQYLKASSLDPNRAEPYNALGTLRAAEGKTAEAQRLFRKALQLNPGFQAAQHNLDELLAVH
jgi:tetratricopeptide (TPR) repeat protein